MASAKPVGKVTHFYDRIGVAVVTLDRVLKIGDRIKIGKADSFFEQEVRSMQFDHKPLQSAKKGQEVGLKVDETVHSGDLLFKA